MGRGLCAQGSGRALQIPGPSRLGSLLPPTLGRAPYTARSSAEKGMGGPDMRVGWPWGGQGHSGRKRPALRAPSLGVCLMDASGSVFKDLTVSSWVCVRTKNPVFKTTLYYTYAVSKSVTPLKG